MKYTVTLKRSETQTATCDIEVEAANEEEALKEALALEQSDEGIEWNVNYDYPLDDHGDPELAFIHCEECD
jgi:hypothetical protein